MSFFVGILFYLHGYFKECFSLVFGSFTIIYLHWLIFYKFLQVRTGVFSSPSHISSNITHWPFPCYNYLNILVVPLYFLYLSYLIYFHISRLHCKQFIQLYILIHKFFLNIFNQVLNSVVTFLFLTIFSNLFGQLW